MDFRLFNKVIQVKDLSKGVNSIEVRFVANDFKGQVNITDIMLQGGGLATNWNYHPSEIRWSHDE